MAEGGAAGECLDDQTLLELVEGRLDAAGQGRVHAHASRCAECRRLLSLLARRSSAPRASTTQAKVAAWDERAEGLRPGDAVGRYVVQRHVGVGGMGEVYAAHDPELGRTVALKVLRTDFERASTRLRMQERLRREAHAMAQLAHPNVVSVYDVGVAGDRVFLTMELVDGVTLAEWSKSASRSLGELLERYLAAGRGLAAAHAAGLVHRDFKPENVLVGADGRVRVGDFGLARGAADSDSATGLVTGEARLADRMLTAPGAIVGTPYYMSPEQRRGEEADARSDQFSYCVALFTAIHGRRPDEGEVKRVPRRVRVALLRGLSPAPAERFASMELLLTALAGPPRRGAWIAAGLLAGAVAAAVTVTRPTTVSPCRDMERHLVGVWDAARREAAVAALTATGASYAGASARAVAAVMDAHARRWVAMRAEACEATRVYGEQTEAQLELRMACLDERLRELGALGDRLISADAAVVERAVQAAYSLTDLAGCEDLEMLASPLPLPGDAAARERIAGLRARLIEVKSLRDAGRLREALTAVRAMAYEVEAEGYRPLTAEALFIEGALTGDLGEFAAAEVRLGEAVWAAEASRHDAIAARALTESIVVIGVRQARHAEAEGLRARATAALERMHRPAEAEASLLQATAAVANDAGKFVEAEEDLGRALGLLERRYGAGDLRLTEPLRALAQVALHRSDGPRALELITQSLEIQRRVYGEEHPTIATSLEALAGAEYLSSAYEQAELHYRQAQAVYERAYGAEHHKVANVLHNRGLVRLWQGEAEEAEALQRRAVELATRTLGTEHPMVAAYLGAQAAALETGGKLDEARALLRLVLVRQRSGPGVNLARVADTLHAIARVEMALGSLEAARRTAIESREVHAVAYGREEPDAATARTLGEVLFRLGRSEEAVEVLREAVAETVASDDPGEAAWTDGLLGRALYESGARDAESLRLMSSALERMGADERMREQRAELEAWITARKLARRLAATSGGAHGGQPAPRRRRFRRTAAARAACAATRAQGPA